MRKDISPGQQRGGDVLHGKSEEEIRNYFMEVFGIDLSDYYISMTRKRAYISTAKPFQKGKTGITLCRISAGIKPTTYAMQLLGRKATKRTVKLSREEALRFVEGYDIEKPIKMDNGYVLVFHGGDCLGVGYFRDGLIENKIPKAIRRNIIR